MIFEELEKLADIQREEDEPRERFVHRLLLAIDLKEEEDFKTLTNVVQKYFNRAVIAHNKQKPLPKFPDEARKKKPKKQTKEIAKALGDDAVIRILVDHNPKRRNSRSYGEFTLYKEGMTVSEYLNAGGSRAGIRWDLDKQFIRLE